MLRSGERILAESSTVFDVTGISCYAWSLTHCLGLNKTCKHCVASSVESEGVDGLAFLANMED